MDIIACASCNCMSGCSFLATNVKNRYRAVLFADKATACLVSFGFTDDAASAAVRGGSAPMMRRLPMRLLAGVVLAYIEKDSELETAITSTRFVCELVAAAMSSDSSG